MKVVINSCHGGFELSDKAVALLAKKCGCSVENICKYDFDRADPVLVKVVEELGAEANGSFAKLKIVEIPDNVEYQIDEYDGEEWVAERHRTWS